jgi:hypothetical protein
MGDLGDCWRQAFIEMKFRRAEKPEQSHTVVRGRPFVGGGMTLLGLYLYLFESKHVDNQEKEAD